ncbi:TetR family transcriptional regulator C-terminal domain-containing protein [Sphingobium sp.]|uniref:TetR family transcriptional regulator C-terminal domain-containing protein n=1 Tax=Sphingobium sp. TaxID=1912891 RepID=UPI00263582B3|nr:TetR family transcriptional regulator C-terminal domain-containing protein [Sphingobium sp.]
MAQPAGPRARARFVRETPDVRRQALIDATARCLAEKGIGGTSVRAICARAGVSSGLLTHYFPGVDALILATYVDVGARVSAALDAAIASAGNDPRDRLRACLLANLRPPVLDPDLLATWIAFWSLVTSDPAIAAVHADVYRGTRHQLETLLGEAAPQLSQAQKRIAAISLTALVDGLWLELCLDRSSFTAEEAQAMVESAMMQWLGANDEQVDKSGAL